MSFGIAQFALSKRVNDLDDPDLRNDLWLDADGFVWYFDYRKEDWRTLGQVLEPTNSGYANARTLEVDGWPDGPFTRIIRGQRVA